MNLQTKKDARTLLASRIFEVIFGIVAPILCVAFDPIVFRPEGRMSGSFLSNIRLFGYLEIGAGILALGYYLATRRSSAFLAGLLWGGAIFSLLLGILMLPLTIVGIFFVIGVLGLTPFFTSFVFFRNALRCWRETTAQSSANPRRLAAALGLFFMLGSPAGLQCSTMFLTDHAIQTVMSGSEHEFERAMKTLRWMRFMVKSDRIALAYEQATDQKQRERLASAFQAVTGQTVQQRLAELHD